MTTFSTDLELDPSTGLPALPKHHYWYTYIESYGFRSFYRISIRRKVRFLGLTFGYQTVYKGWVNNTSETPDYNGLTTSSPLTPDRVKSAAISHYWLYQSRLKTADVTKQMLGAFPPKSVI